MSEPSEKELTGMLKSLSLFLLISTVLGVVGIIVTFDPYQGSTYSARAVCQIPNSAISIILERRNIHLFLAEYERTLVLDIDGKEVLRHEVAIDTGGYSRMNVFRISEDEYLLVGQLSFDRYLLNVSTKALHRLREGSQFDSGRFVGSFDRDEKGWRFISVSERSIQKSLIAEYEEVQL